MNSNVADIEERIYTVSAGRKVMVPVSIGDYALGAVVSVEGDEAVVFYTVGNTCCQGKSLDLDPGETAYEKVEIIKLIAVVECIPLVIGSTVMVPRSSGNYSLGTVLAINTEEAFVSFPVGNTFRGESHNYDPLEMAQKQVAIERLIAVAN